MARDQAERRIVTALFLDVVGSTSSLGEQGPERMKQLLDRAFSELQRIIAGHGGTIEKYVGDAVFALFGAPVAHEDDAMRALRAAEECARWSRETEAAPAIRIGIETGDALVDMGAVASDRGRMAVGQCINVAARLQSHAEPGHVLVGPICAEAVAREAELRSIGELELKGVGSIPVWELVRTRASEGRPRLRFVGRSAELGLMRDAKRRADAGAPVLLLLIGPPGQGKSRLADEFIERSAAMRVLRGRCRPDTELGSQHPLLQLLASELGEVTREAIADTLLRTGVGPVEATRAADALAHSASIIVSPRLLPLSPGDRMIEIAGAWRHYLVPPAGGPATVLWIEDLHWAEPALVRLIDVLGTGTGTGPLIVATARPEIVDSPALRASHERIFVGPLATDDALELAREASSAAEALVARAEGNPLFIIELGRSRVGTADLPVTVQAAIAARIDELSADDRELLQRSAVAGETFSVRDAAVLTPRPPAEIAGALARLTHLGHLDPVGANFRFHHALARDVAYGRVPLAERMRSHARFAQEAVDPNDVEALAHHWWSALPSGEVDLAWAPGTELDAHRREAFRTHLAAGRRASERFANDRAIELLERARTFAGGPEDVGQIEEALGTAHHGETRGNEAWSHRLLAIDAFRAAGREPPASVYADMLEMAVFNYGYFKTIPAAAEIERLLVEGARVADQEGDPISHARLVMERAMFMPPFDGAALAASAAAVAASDDLRAAGVTARMAQVFGVHEFDRAEALYETAEVTARRGGWVNEAEMFTWRARTAIDRGQLAQAGELAVRLAELAQRRSAHTRSHSLGLDGTLAFVRGDRTATTRAAHALRELMAANPAVSWCLVGSAAIAGAAAQEIAAGQEATDDLADVLGRMMPSSPSVQASMALIPGALRGGADLDRARRSHAWETVEWDQDIWDVAGLNIVVALVILGRWSELDPALARLRVFAATGGRLAAAVADAAEEERAAATGGPRPTHAALRAIGANGYSELLGARAAVRA